MKYPRIEPNPNGDGFVILVAEGQYYQVNGETIVYDNRGQANVGLRTVESELAAANRPLQGASDEAIKRLLESGEITEDDVRNEIKARIQADNSEDGITMPENVLNAEVDTRFNKVAPKPETQEWPQVKAFDDGHYIVDEKFNKLSPAYDTQGSAQTALEQGNYQEAKVGRDIAEGIKTGIAQFSGAIGENIDQFLEQSGIADLKGMTVVEIANLAKDGIITPEEAYLGIQFAANDPLNAEGAVKFLKGRKVLAENATVPQQQPGRVTTGPEQPVQAAGTAITEGDPNMLAQFDQNTDTASVGGEAANQAAPIPQGQQVNQGWWTANITQPYGPTSTTLDSGYKGAPHFNKGLDFGVTEGTPITSNIKGTVIAAGDQGDGWGLSVKVQDSQGYIHNYGHLSNINVKKGDKVTLNTPLGASGSTGKSTGPHLSYDVLSPKGEWIEPSNFLLGVQYAPAEGHGAYTQEDIATLYDAAAKAGFVGESIHRAVATALAESGSTGFQAHNTKGEDSRGPLQINVGEGAHTNLAGLDLNDPYVAMSAAFDISSGGTDFSPWSVWQDSITTGDGQTINVGKPAEGIFNNLISAGGSGEGGLIAAGQESQGGLIPFDPEADKINAQDILAQERAKYEAAGFKVWQNNDGTFRLGDPNTGRMYDIGVGADGSISQSFVGMSSGLRSESVTPLGGTDDPSLEKAVLAAEGEQAVYDAFFEQYGRMPTPAEAAKFVDQAPGRAVSSYGGVANDPERQRNLDVAGATDGRFIYNDPTQTRATALNARGQTVDDLPANVRFTAEAQALHDIYPTMPTTESVYDEEGNVRGVSQGSVQRPQTVDQSLYDFSPGLYTGEASFTAQVGGEEDAAGFAGIPFSPTDPGQGARIAAAVSSGTENQLQNKDRIALSQAKQQSQVQPGDPEVVAQRQQKYSEAIGNAARALRADDAGSATRLLSGIAGAGDVNIGEVLDQLGVFGDLRKQLIELYGQQRNQAYLGELRKMRGDQSVFGKQETQVAGQVNNNDNNDSGNERTRVRVPKGEKPTPIPDPYVPPSPIAGVGPYTVQPPYFAEGGQVITDRPTALVDVQSGQQMGTISEMGQSETVTITPGAGGTGSSRMPMPSFNPMPAKTLAQQGIGGIKGEPTMKNALANASQRYRMMLESIGVSPLIAQEMARSKMQTPAGQVKFINDNKAVLT